MDSLHFNIYSADIRHAQLKAYISTFTMQIPAMLHGQSTFQHLLLRFPPCYMDSLHSNIYSADSRHATWTAYIPTFTLRIPAMLHGQPTMQHLLCRFPPCYVDSVQCNTSEKGVICEVLTTYRSHLSWFSQDSPGSMGL